MINQFVAHSCELVRQLDPTHAITVGVAKWDNQDVIEMIDVLSCHSYAKGVEAFRADITRTYDPARAAGKPWIVMECCNPAAGSTYEMAMPVLRELEVGHFVWQLIIGRDQFNSASGLVYPDGMVRRIPQIEAVMNASASAFTEKPDEVGLPIRHDLSVQLARYLEQILRDGVSEVNWRERVTLVESFVAQPFHYGDAKNEVAEAVVKARQFYESGDRKTACAAVARLIEKAAEPLRRNPPEAAPRFALTATVYRDIYGILFIDPHWPADGQNSWWECHVHVGRTQVGGFAFPGLPFIGPGYTDGVAWAATADRADSANAFELQINPKNADQYWQDDRWRDMVIRQVSIRVKTESSDVEERNLRIRESIHGPVVLEKDGRVLVAAICGVRDTTRLEQWLAMNLAQTVAELRDAFRMDQASWLNITYATRDGHLGYIQTGMCPKRGSGPYQMLGLVDGSRSETNWQGRIPFDELPQLHDPKTGDPKTGWLQSCNTAANYVTQGQTIRQEDFPPGALIRHYSADGRLWRGTGHRCFEVMPKMNDVTHKQARQFALETYAPAGPIWAEPLCVAYDAYKHEVRNPDLSIKMMAGAVRGWDDQVRKESVGATAFSHWRMECKLHPEAVGPNKAFGAPKTELEQRDAVQALRSAADYVKKTFGSTLVPWGQLLRLRRGDLDLPLDGDVGFFGGMECMRATGNSTPRKDGRYVFSGVQVIPTVVEMTDPIQIWSIVPYGQSRRPESRHYADQAPLYSEGRMLPAWHTWSQLRDHVKSTKVLEYSQRTRELELGEPTNGEPSGHSAQISN